MNLKNYAKLLLILGLCAGVPAQGMSYVNYIKSFFISKAEAEKAKIEKLAEPGKTIARTVIELNAQGNHANPTITHIKNNRELVIAGISRFQKVFNNKQFDELFPPFVKVAPPIVTPQLPEQLKSFVARFVSKEKELFNNGYYTFLHGQPREAYFLQKVYTHLWCVKTKQTINNFLFAHIKPLLKTAQEKDKERATYNALHAQGCTESFRMSEFDNLLFVSHALFANISYRPGCCSGFYALMNMKKREYDIKAPFAALDYDWVYERFKSEIDQLAKEYQNICSCGSLLMLAIPKDKVNNYVFLADSSGKRMPIMIKGQGLTDNTQKMLGAIYKNPEKVSLTGQALAFGYHKNTDLLEFCVIMTRENGGLDPSTGIQVHPILPGDPAKLAELQKKEDALFAKIKAAIEQEENSKAIALNRASAILNHLVLPGKEARGVAPAKTMARINNIMGHIQSQEQMN